VVNEYQDIHEQDTTDYEEAHNLSEEQDEDGGITINTDGSATVNGEESADNELMIEEAMNVNEHNPAISDVPPGQLMQTECQTDMVEAVVLELHSGSKECQTVPVLMVDKECQTEDVVILSAYEQHLLPFDQQDMSDNKKVKYYTGLSNLPTLLLLLK